MPAWLFIVAALSLVAAFLSAAVIIWDMLAGHHQKMWIMNIVWPVTALYAGPLALIGYFSQGRLNAKSFDNANGPKPDRMHAKVPFWKAAAVATTHCGAGCTLGDIAAEAIVVAVPMVVFGQRIFGTWILDYVLAYALGIVFQYFTIKPMKNLSMRDGIVAAVKADTLSLTSWQVGMYGWMAIVTFLILRHEIPKTNPVFWFMMQIGMLAGFLTSYPVNWWLLRNGTKEQM